MPIRIGVDLAPLKGPLTGVGNYTYHLLEALVRSPRAPAVEGFQGFSWRSIQQDYFEQHQIEGQEASLLRRAASIRWLREHEGARRLYTRLRGKIFETSARTHSISLFHAFAYMPPGQLTVPTIPVVYDVSFVRFPDMHPRARMRALETLGMHINAASAVHTISLFSAREIADVYGIEPSRITVVYPGVKPIFAQPSFDSSSVLANHKLKSGEYYLVVSTLEPRKNLRTLVSAYMKLPKTLRTRLPLCIVGAAGWNHLDLPAGFDNLEAEGSLRFLGFVPDEELRSLYEHARVMMYPSSYEGFGMPIIEALACGAPVVCSNVTSMPEAAGTVSRMVEPFDVEAWANELRRAADDPSSDQRQMRQAHAARFTWERGAQQTLDLYAKVLGY